MQPPRYLVALITPFDSAGEIDLEAHRHNLRTLREAGVEGFVLGGSNGEGPYLEPGERGALVTAVRDELGNGAFVMCGVMAETLRLGLRQVEEASQAGADAVLALTPTTLTRGRPGYVRSYFESLAGASTIPCFLYSVPNTTAYSLEEQLVSELAGHPNIVGMKDSSGDPIRLQRILASVPDGFLVWSGSSQALTLSVTAGAHGSITGSGNYAPRLVLETLETALADPFKARDLQQRLSEVSRRIESHGIPAVKATSEEAGLRPGLPRAPLAPLPDGLAEELRALLR